MATTKTAPAETTGALELPSTDAVLAQSRTEVSWSPTPKENAQETIQKRKIPIQYIFLSSLSITKVMKETLLMLQKTGPGFMLVSRIDSTVTLHTIADFDKIPIDEFPKCFPAKVSGGKTFLPLFSVSMMPINRLKRSTFGFYEYAARKIWINEDVFLSNDIRNIGFLIRKDPKKVSCDLLTISLSAVLSNHKLDAKNSHHFHEAQEALPFTSKILTFTLRNSTNVHHANASGNIKTNALTIHCDAKHAEFVAKLFTTFYDDGHSDEQFIPRSLLYGSDPTNISAYRNAIVHQNQYLTDVRVLPVIGISPKALK
jgi:hypothetical protein